jgi:hypothetical protein
MNAFQDKIFWPLMSFRFLEIKSIAGLLVEKEA